MTDVYSVEESQRSEKKRYDLFLRREGQSFIVASLYTDAKWFIEWLNESLRSNQPQQNKGK